MALRSAKRRRATSATAPAPNSKTIGGAGTSVPPVLVDPPELLDELEEELLDDEEVDEELLVDELGVPELDDPEEPELVLEPLLVDELDPVDPVLELE